MRYVLPTVFLFAVLLGAGCTTTGTLTERSYQELETNSDTVRAGLVYSVEVSRSRSMDEVIATVEPGKRMAVTAHVQYRYSDGSGGELYQVKFGDTKGWVEAEHVLPPSEYSRHAESLKALRDSGVTLIPVSQRTSKNSADGISIFLAVANISESKTVKYVRTTWQLYNGVGDPVEGENKGNSMAEVRLTGPVKPGQLETATLENIWYSPTGECAELQGLQIEHIDGTSKSVTDLEAISGFPAHNTFMREESTASVSLIVAEPVRMVGDCSYEAQQSRENEIR